MSTNLVQQLSEQDLPTHHLFNIFSKLRLMLVAGLLLLPQLLAAQWNATVGAESNDLGGQGLAFLPNEIWIHAGDSITWTVAAAEPHTVTFLTDGQIRPPFNVGCPGFSTGSAIFDGSSCITSALLFKDAKLTVTFGTEPQDPVPPSSNVTVDADGERHAEVNSTSDSVHSGFLQAAPQDRVGLPQASSGITRFRVTFSKPGIYPYICALHDGLGMKGKVVVLP